MASLYGTFGVTSLIPAKADERPLDEYYNAALILLSLNLCTFHCFYAALHALFMSTFILFFIETQSANL